MTSRFAKGILEYSAWFLLPSFESSLEGRFEAENAPLWLKKEAFLEVLLIP